MTTDPTDDTRPADAVPTPGARAGFSLIEVLVVLAIIALLIAFLLPAVRSGSGEAVRRAQCVNNLKQIAVALYNYEDAYKVLPPAYTADASGRPLHSWRTLILPYLEQESLYRTIDLSKPWNDPANAQALEAMPPVFRCPGASRPRNTTSYLATTGPDGYLVRGESRRLAEITDEHASTLAVIEADDEHAVPWMAPVDAGESLVIGLGPTTKLHHSGGFNASFVDGSVRFLKVDLPAQVRRALMTINGGETIKTDQY
jgi:prepilin-type N-terminal cleavage/methylation domain-containing protein/prepilin-type processing-associated H-X9-DG protein